MKREGGEGDYTKERLRNEPLSDEFARAWALQNGIAEWILLARPCCMDHPEGCLIIVFFNTGDNLDAT